MDDLKDANLLQHAKMSPLSHITEPRRGFALLTTHGTVILYGIANPDTDEIFFAVRTHADDVRQNTALMRCLLEDSFTEAAPMEEMEKMLDPEAEGDLYILNKELDALEPRTPEACAKLMAERYASLVAEGKALVADGSYPQSIAKRVAWHMAEEVGLRFPELMNRLVQ